MNTDDVYHVESEVFSAHPDPAEAAQDLRKALESSDWEVIYDGDKHHLVHPT